MKVKIAFLTRNYPPDTLWGGDAVVYYNLARGLARLGHEVHVICQAVGKPKDCVEEGVFVHRVGTNPKRYSAIARINYSFYVWRKLKDIIKKYGIEIVEAPYWSAEGFSYCFKKRTPLIVWTQSSPRDAMRTKNYTGLAGLLNLKLLSNLADFTAKRADRVIADSKGNYERVIKEIHINPDKVDIAHLGIDIAKFKPTGSKIGAKLGISLQEPLILFIGRLEARKGLHILCQAIPSVLRSIPEAKFVLVGKDTDTAPSEGSFKQHILEEAQIHHFKDNVTFIDFLPENELIQLYSACDLFVFPSLHESFGLPIIEAMACGRPVVATSTGIVPELEPYGLSGLKVVPIGDTEKLAQAIIEMLLIKEEDKIQIAKQNREFVKERFAISVWVDKMLKYYEKTLGRTT